MAVLFSLAPALPAFAQASKTSETEVRLGPVGDTGENDLFGSAAAIGGNGNTMVIGGQGANSAALPDTGAAFIFERVQNQWRQTARLVASDARSLDDFGNNVAISEDGNTVVVAADQQTLPSLPSAFGQQAGAVYVFQRVNGAWTQQAEIASPTPVRNGSFGTFGIGISGNTIAVADLGGIANGFTPGVDVFTWIDGTWQLTATLTVPEDFGFPLNLAISGSTLVASSNDDFTSAGGAAYVFVLANGMWTRQATLTPADATFGANFGSSLAVNGGVIAVGASNGPGAASSSGAAYVFAKEEGVWSQKAKLVASDGISGTYLAPASA